MRYFSMMPMPDGSLGADAVEPGTYLVDFVAENILPSAVSQMRAPSMVITIPADPPTGHIDLGVITLQPAPPPR